MSNVSNYNFISSNVKGIQASKKRLKLSEYLKIYEPRYIAYIATSGSKRETTK